MIPKPLAWGIIVVLTGLETLNVVAAVFRNGYVSDPWVHFVFSSIVSAMLAMKEGSGVVPRIITALRGPMPPVPPAPPADPTTSPSDPQAPPS